MVFEEYVSIQQSLENAHTLQLTFNDVAYTLRHGTPISSRVVKGVSGLLSGCRVELRIFLELPQGSQTSLRVVRGNSGFHSSHCRGVRPYLSRVEG